MISIYGIAGAPYIGLLYHVEEVPTGQDPEYLPHLLHLLHLPAGGGPPALAGGPPRAPLPRTGVLGRPRREPMGSIPQGRIPFITWTSPTWYRSPMCGAPDP